MVPTKHPKGPGLSITCEGERNTGPARNTGAVCKGLESEQETVEIKLDFCALSELKTLKQCTGKGMMFVKN